MTATVVMQGQNMARAAEQMSSTVRTAKQIKNFGSKVQSGISIGRSIVSTVDGLFQGFFGFSPVDEWIKKPFSGDWDAMLTTAEKWESLSTCLDGSAKATGDVANAVGEGTSWSGKGANKFIMRSTSLRDVLKVGISPCQEAAKGLKALADLAEQTLDFLLTMIEEIVNILVTIAGDFAVPGLGLAKGTLDAMRVLRSVCTLVTEGWNYLQKLLTVSSSFSTCVAQMGQASSLSEQALADFGMA